MNSFFLHLATFFGAGRLPKGPGTWGSLAALPLAALLMWGASPLVYMGFCLFLFPIGTYAAEVYERKHGGHDHSEIVIDEVLGMLITLTCLPLTWRSLVLGFGLFRFFDILKPFPISYLDKNVRGGLGVMVDDVLAGLFANIILQVIYQQTAWLGSQWIM